MKFLTMAGIADNKGTQPMLRLIRFLFFMGGLALLALTALLYVDTSDEDIVSSMDAGVARLSQQAELLSESARKAIRQGNEQINKKTRALRSQSGEAQKEFNEAGDEQQKELAKIGSEAGARADELKAKADSVASEIQAKLSKYSKWLRKQLAEWKKRIEEAWEEQG